MGEADRISMGGAGQHLYCHRPPTGRGGDAHGAQSDGLAHLRSGARSAVPPSQRDPRLWSCRRFSEVPPAVPLVHYVQQPPFPLSFLAREVNILEFFLRFDASLVQQICALSGRSLSHGAGSNESSEAGQCTGGLCCATSRGTSSHPPFASPMPLLPPVSSACNALCHCIMYMHYCYCIVPFCMRFGPKVWEEGGNRLREQAFAKREWSFAGCFFKMCFETTFQHSGGGKRKELRTPSGNKSFQSERHISSAVLFQTCFGHCHLKHKGAGGLAQEAAPHPLQFGLRLGLRRQLLGQGNPPLAGPLPPNNPGLYGRLAQPHRRAHPPRIRHRLPRPPVPQVPPVPHVPPLRLRRRLPSSSVSRVQHDQGGEAHPRNEKAYHRAVQQKPVKGGKMGKVVSRGGGSAWLVPAGSARAV